MRICRPGGFVNIFLYNKWNHWRHNLQKNKVNRLAGPDLEKRFGVAHRLFGTKPIDQMTPAEIAGFYDQYCHPHKSDHTLGETLGWLKKQGLAYWGSYPPLRFRDFMAMAQYRGTLAKDYPFFHTRLSKTIAKASFRLPSMECGHHPLISRQYCTGFSGRPCMRCREQEVDTLAVPPCAGESTTRANAKTGSSAGVQAQMIPTSYSALCRNLRIRLKDRIIHPNTAAYWPQCLAVDRMTCAQLLELQQERLHKLFQHAIRHVPFYRQWAQQAGHTSDHPPPLNLWPIATKDLFRANPDAFQSEAFPRNEMSLKKTSGSSGEPFQFRVHRSATDYSYACLWRALSRHGLRPGDRRVYIWGRGYLFISSAAQIQKTRLRQNVRNWLNNTLAVNAYDLTHHNVDKTIDAIEQFRPVYLHGYVASLHHRATNGGDESVVSEL